MKKDLLASTSTFAISYPGLDLTENVTLRLWSIPPSLASILLDMKRAFDAGLYYPALLIALTLPDICASLSLPKDKFVKQADYVRFIDTYTDPRALGIDGLGCYRLRGGVVHRGNAAGHPYLQFENILFSTPNSQMHMHGTPIVVGGVSALMFNLEMFCAEMERAVTNWYYAHSADPFVSASISNLLSWRPEGMAPFISGSGVIGAGPERADLSTAFRIGQLA